MVGSVDTDRAPAPARDVSALVACAHATVCAGCPQIVSRYGEQLAAKHARVVASVRRYAALDAVAIAPVASADPFTRYRTRAKFMVAPGPRLGLYAREGDHVVVDIPECLVLAPPLAEAADALRALLHAPPPGTGGALVPLGSPGGALVAVDSCARWTTASAARSSRWCSRPSARRRSPS